MIHLLWLSWHTSHAWPQFCALAIGSAASHASALIAGHCSAHSVAEGGFR